MRRQTECHISRRSFIGLMGLIIVPSLMVAPTAAYADDERDTELVIPEISYDESDSIFNMPSTRSWYGSTLDMTGTAQYTGSVRDYDGSNVGIEMTCYTTGSPSGCDRYFSVELHRKSGAFDSRDDYVGSAAFKRNGFTKATWTNVGAGRYCFKFVKCADNQVLHSNSVAMYSW